MHAVQLADLAAIIALHGPTLLFRREMISDEALHAYWLANRKRCDVWHERLGAFRQHDSAGETVAMREWWRTQYPMLEEVLLAEPLTRLYAALGASLDAGRDSEEIGPITHSVFLSHLEARNRVLQLMIYGRGLSIEQAVRLNRLRAAAESWSDSMLGYMMVRGEKNWERYALDAPRARAFAEDARQLAPGAARDTAGWLMSAAMRDSLSRRSQSEAATPEANQAVADAVLMCLRPDLFDSVGMLKSLWLHRLQRGAEQADRVLDELAHGDLNAGPTLTGYEVIRNNSFGRWLA